MPGMKHKPLAYGMRANDIKQLTRKYPQLTQSQVKALVTQVLIGTTKNVTKDMRKWINSKVPKMTGRLRRDLLNHLRTSYVSNAVMRVYVQTDVDYAKRVNDFKTSNVRHRGKRIKYRGRTIVLHDFRAVGNFFNLMVKFAIHSIQVNLDRQKRRYSVSSKIKSKDMRIKKLW